MSNPHTEVSAEVEGALEDFVRHRHHLATQRVDRALAAFDKEFSSANARKLHEALAQRSEVERLGEDLLDRFHAKSITNERTDEQIALFGT